MGRKTGTKTKHKGIVKVHDGVFLVRVTKMDPQTKVKKEVESTVKNCTLEDALIERAHEV